MQPIHNCLATKSIIHFDISIFVSSLLFIVSVSFCLHVPLKECIRFTVFLQRSVKLRTNTFAIEFTFHLQGMFHSKMLEQLYRTSRATKKHNLP